MSSPDYWDETFEERLVRGLLWASSRADAASTAPTPPPAEPATPVPSPEPARQTSVPSGSSRMQR